VSPAQERALVEYGPLYCVPFTHRILDFSTLFGREAPTVLEIGFGMGETSAAIASARPDLNFLGVEVHTPGVGALLKRIAQESLQNVRIIQHDAVEVLEAMIPLDSLAGVHLFFPDPWHKARHHKRRLVQQAFISDLARRLLPMGYIHCATDWEDYAFQMLEVLKGEPLLANSVSEFAQMTNPLVTRPRTKFQERGIRLGHGVWDLVFQRQR
jgi:tRNA (guanine-N7-)-methyltransferase